MSSRSSQSLEDQFAQVLAEFLAPDPQMAQSDQLSVGSSESSEEAEAPPQRKETPKSRRTSTRKRKTPAVPVEKKKLVPKRKATTSISGPATKRSSTRAASQPPGTTIGLIPEEEAAGDQSTSGTQTAPVPELEVTNRGIQTTPGADPVFGANQYTISEGMRSYLLGLTPHPPVGLDAEVGRWLQDN